MTKLIVAALALAALGACSAPPPPYNPNSISAQCYRELEEMQRRNAAISRRTRAAEAAYIATRDAKIAAANQADLAREDEQLARDIEAHRIKCRGA